MTSKSNDLQANRKSPASGKALLAPFSRLIAVEDVPDAGLDIAIEATAAERAAIAANDKLVTIGKLEAQFHIAHRPGHVFNVRGSVIASITQTCVVSLDPFETDIAEEVNVDFVQPGDLTRAKAEAVLSHDRAKPDNEEKDPPDVIVDGKIDLGALADEFLALALDPYPRKPGVRFEGFKDVPEDGRDSPFAILRKRGETP